MPEIRLDRLDIVTKEITEVFAPISDLLTAPPNQTPASAKQLARKDPNKSLTRYYHERQFLHPLTSAWYQLCEDIQNSTAKKMLLFSDESLRFLETYGNCCKINDKDDLAIDLRKMRAPNEYESTEFEISTYISYQNSGLKPKFVPEKDTRTPDIVLNLRTPIWIECKKLLDKTKTDSVHWKLIEESCIQILTEYRRAWKVSFVARKSIKGLNVRFLSDIIRKHAKNNDLSTDFFNDNINIVFSENADWGALFPVPHKFRHEATGFRMLLDVTENERGLFFCNLRICQWSYARSSFSVRTVENSIRAAYGQLPQGEPSLVHIGLPSTKAGDLTEIVDQIYDPIYKNFHSFYSQLAGVALCGMVPNPAMTDGAHGFTNEVLFVPNWRTINPLPPEFICPQTGSGGPTETMLRAHHNDLEQNFRAEGTILFEYRLNRPIKDLAGQSLYDFCSKDGMRQARVWTSHAGTIRFEVIHPAFGRRVLRTNIKELPTLSKIGFTWSKDGVSAVINGDIIEKQPIDTKIQ